MPAKDVLEKIKEQLKSVINDEERRTLAQARKPEEVSGLLQKYKKLALELKTRGVDEIGGIMSQLVKVRRELSSRFKEERQEAINEHWKEIQQQNSKFIAKVEQQIEAADKESDAFFERFDRETREMQTVEKQAIDLQSELNRANENLEQLNKETLEHEEVSKQEENLESDFRQEFSDTSVPRPSFRDSLRQTMDDKENQAQTQEQFGLSLRQRMEDSFNKCRRFILENPQLSPEEQSTKLEQLQNIQKRYMDQLNGMKLESLFKSYQERFLQSQKVNDIYHQFDAIKQKVGTMLDQDGKALSKERPKLGRDKVGQVLREGLEESQSDQQPGQTDSPFDLNMRLKKQ